MSRKPLTLPGLLILSGLLVSACGPGVLFGPTVTPTPSPTPSRTPTPRPTSTPRATRTATATQPTAGKGLGITDDGQDVALIDYDYRYIVLLPLKPQPFSSIVIKPQDPRIPISIGEAPGNVEARFIAYSESTNSYVLVTCQQPTRIGDIETYIGSRSKDSSTLESKVITTEKGLKVGFTYFIHADLVSQSVLPSYEIVFLVDEGQCTVSSSLPSGTDESVSLEYYLAMERIAKMIILLDP